MAASIRPLLSPTPDAFAEPSAPDAAADTPAAPNLPDPRQRPALAALLASTHAVYRACVADWLTAERRQFGGSPALSELQPFAGESATDYAIRQRKATYVPFGKVYASANAGHLLRQMPMPNMGALGAVRTREARGTGRPSLGELIWYNVDGVGSDGTSWDAWWARVTEEIHGPGFRWIFVEAPPGDGAATAAEGRRPYLVDFTPAQVPNWHFADGRLEWAIVRVPTRRPRLGATGYEGNDAETGYYLLVRRGFQGFGAPFARGGWWTFDGQMAPLAAGDWSRTRGEIPLFLYAYERSDGLRGAGAHTPGVVPVVRGTTSSVLGEETATLLGASAVQAPVTAYPALARSGTLEVGNVSVALMDAISERDYDAREAAASTLTVAGVNPGYKDADGAAVQNNFNDFAALAALRAKLLPLPASVIPTGVDAQDRRTFSVVVPTVQDSSLGAVPAEVYEKIIASKFTEAREIIARELTAAPDSSGASKQAGFTEGKSPRLALLAGNCEAAMNAALYFLELRAGAEQPRAYVTLPRDYDLAPVLDTIDRALERLQVAQLRSPTLAVSLTARALDEDGLMPEAPRERQAVLDELRESASAAVPTALEQLLGGGALGTPDAASADGSGPPPAEVPTTRSRRRRFTTTRDASGALVTEDTSED